LKSTILQLSITFAALNTAEYDKTEHPLQCLTIQDWMSDWPIYDPSISFSTW